MKRKHFTEIQIKNITWMCFAKNGSISFKWTEFQIWAAKTIIKKNENSCKILASCACAFLNEVV